MRAAFLISTAALLFSAPAFGQAIEVGQLGSAAAFDVGVIDSQTGGLDKNLWQATSAARAQYLLETVNAKDASGVARDLIRAAVLTGGSPPRFENAEQDTDFKKARLKVILDLGEMSAAQSIINRTPVLSEDNVLKANMALLAGDNQGACASADIIVEDRADPVWARLRAFCHVLRGEIPAAELTTDILKAAEYEDPAFYSLMQIVSGGSSKPDLKAVKSDDALHMALMTKAALPWPKGQPSKSYAARLALSEMLPGNERLAAMQDAGNALSNSQMEQVFDSLIAAATKAPDDEPELAGQAPTPAELPSLDEALSKKDAASSVALYQIARSGAQVDRPKAVAALLQRADTAGAFDRFSSFLAPLIQTLSPEEQVLTDLNIFTRAAIARGDTSVLRQFYDLVSDQPDVQPRIALVSDALGYGFLGGGLGTDIETRIAEEDTDKARVVRDMFIAAAMGAGLSVDAMANVEGLKPSTGRALLPGQRLALETSARSGARAETALWAAKALQGERLNTESLYTVITALNQAGLTRFAGRLAAEDFWTGL